MPNSKNTSSGDASYRRLSQEKKRAIEFRWPNPRVSVLRIRLRKYRLGKTDLSLSLFFLDDDSWSHHHHETLRFTPHTNVLEQTVDKGKVAQHGNTTFVTTLAETLDTTQENGTSVRNTDGRIDRGAREDRKLNG